MSLLAFRLTKSTKIKLRMVCLMASIKKKSKESSLTATCCMQEGAGVGAWVGWAVKGKKHFQEKVEGDNFLTSDVYNEEERNIAKIRRGEGESA